MKKYLIAILILLSNISFAQTIQPRGSGNVTVEDQNLFIKNSFAFPRFQDTTAANAARSLDTAGRAIYTYKDNAIWVRLNNPKRWALIGSGAGAIANGLNSIGGITLVDSTVTLLRDIVWTINGVVYTQIVNTSFIIHTADSGYFRRDLISVISLLIPIIEDGFLITTAPLTLLSTLMIVFSNWFNLLFNSNSFIKVSFPSINLFIFLDELYWIYTKSNIPATKEVKIKMIILLLCMVEFHWLKLCQSNYLRSLGGIIKY